MTVESAEASDTVNAVVEMDDTSATAEVFESEITTIGVEEYALANVIVQLLALVPVVNDPHASFAFVPITGEPVPQEDMLGVALVLEAVRWPYWSSEKRIGFPVVVADTAKMTPVVEAV